MKAVVSVIMGSTSDLPVMKKATDFLNEMKVPFEVNALSAHRTPEAVEAFSKGAKERGVKIIIAAAGSASRMKGEDKLLADLCGKSVIARTITAFEKAPSVAEIIIVTKEKNTKS